VERLFRSSRRLRGRSGVEQQQQKQQQHGFATASNKSGDSSTSSGAKPTGGPTVHKSSGKGVVWV
jgi:hypothetical protein